MAESNVSISNISSASKFKSKASSISEISVICPTESQFGDSFNLRAGSWSIEDRFKPLKKAVCNFQN